MREYIQQSLSFVEVPKKGGLLADNVFIGPHLQAVASVPLNSVHKVPSCDYYVV